MTRKVWVFDPHSGGVKIPERVKAETVERIQRHAAKHYAGLYTRINVRFRGALCYIDAYTEPKAPSKGLLKATGESKDEYMDRRRNLPTHLCRLRYFSEDRWSVAFFTYSNEQYSPTMFDNGEWFGTPEQGFDIGAVYLLSQ